MKPISVIVTLSRYAVNRFAGGRGECVLKHTNNAAMRTRL